MTLRPLHPTSRRDRTRRSLPCAESWSSALFGCGNDSWLQNEPPHRLCGFEAKAPSRLTMVSPKKTFALQASPVAVPLPNRARTTSLAGRRRRRWEEESVGTKQVGACVALAEASKLPPSGLQRPLCATQRTGHFASARCEPHSPQSQRRSLPGKTRSPRSSSNCVPRTATGSKMHSCHEGNGTLGPCAGTLLGLRVDDPCCGSLVARCGRVHA